MCFIVLVLVLRGHAKIYIQRTKDNLSDSTLSFCHGVLLDVELKLSELVAGTFTYWGILLTLKIIKFPKICMSQLGPKDWIHFCLFIPKKDIYITQSPPHMTQETLWKRGGKS